MTPRAPTQNCAVRPNRGFTLIEILLTAVVLALLVGLAIPVYRRAMHQAKAQEAVEHLGAIRRAELAYHAGHGTFTEAIDRLPNAPTLGADFGPSRYAYRVQLASADELLIVATGLEPVPGTDQPLKVSIDKDGNVKMDWPGEETSAESTAGGGSSSSGESGEGSPDIGTGQDAAGGGGGTADSGSTSTDSKGSGQLQVITELTATPNDGWVGLGWNTLVPATGFNIYRSTSPDGSFELLAEEYPYTSYPDLSAQNGQSYYYRVTAVMGTGVESVPSMTTAVTPSSDTIYARKSAEALTLLQTVLATGAEPFLTDIGGFIADQAVPLGFNSGVPEGVLGWYDPISNVMNFSTNILNWTAGGLATVLAHEGTHAWFALDPNAAVAATLAEHPSLSESDLSIPEDSLDQEYHAFLADTLIWSQLRDADNPALDLDVDLILNSTEAEAKLELRRRGSYAFLPEF